VPLHRLDKCRDRRRRRGGHPRQWPVVVSGQLFTHHSRLHSLRHHVRRAGGEAELPQVVVGGLLHREHAPHQPAELDRVVHVGGDDRLRGARPHHAGQLERALLMAAPVAAMLQHQIEPKLLPASQARNSREGSERVDLERGEGTGSHYLLHRIGNRDDAKVELQGLERLDPRGELLDELHGLIGMRANQRLPRVRVRDADREMQAGRNPTEGHLARDTHRLVPQSNIQSHGGSSASRGQLRYGHSDDLA
jgi:hypothetical protein